MKLKNFCLLAIQDPLKSARIAQQRILFLRCVIPIIRKNVSLNDDMGEYVAYLLGAITRSNQPTLVVASNTKKAHILVYAEEDCVKVLIY